MMYCFIADIDECQTNHGGCNQICKNSYGSYHCECNIGFKLSQDNHTCLGKICYLYPLPPGGGGGVLEVFLYGNIR